MQSPLFTDFYQLTMMSGYLEAGKDKQNSVFELFFRKIPQQGAFCLLSGLEPALEYLENLQFSDEELGYLGSLKMFNQAFLDQLKGFRFRGTVWAIPEGTVVMPHQPLLRIEASLPEAQLIESALLNMINFNTLIATKAARVVQAAGSDSQVLEFGLRRAQGPDGAMSASRAAFVGGCVATSNSLAGMRYGIPVRGTQAHSWIMSFGDELESFRAYAHRYPDSALLLVDTYDTLGSGVPNAIQVARELKERGHKLAGIRLDSGDLAQLSIAARHMLDEAGFPEVRIVASNDLDEFLVESLRAQGARIDTWGVGTQLVTSKQDPALGGVYKLVSIQEGDHWRPCMKISSNPGKATSPGVKQIHRGLADGQFVGDVIALASENAPQPGTSIHDPLYVTPPRQLEATHFEPLLEKVMENGRRTRPAPALTEIRQRGLDQLARLPVGCLRLQNPHLYPNGLSDELYELRRQLLTARA
ncbi:MAG: nicotinate phosphoribosyltransferase [Candidatus Eremiobacteraeota bacterium]|nr:nicotinate phosphoribosyltransferase [Candidatus Eremiobacteraeota bacterium]MCW5868543.1 nicotinate phosphoribosyltransferase [Candidatus Eremiobacteraeota bacterium]